MLLDYELKQICDESLHKTAGMFGPSNAGEAQAQMSHTTGGADSIEARTARIQSAGQLHQPSLNPGAGDGGSDDDEEEDEGGGFNLGGLGSIAAIGGGIALAGYATKKWGPSISRGVKAYQMGTSAQKKAKELGLITDEDMKSNLDPITRAKNWMRLSEADQKDVLTQLGDIQTDLKDYETDVNDYNEAAKDWDNTSWWNPKKYLHGARMLWNKGQQAWNGGQLWFNEWQLDAEGRGLK